MTEIVFDFENKKEEKKLIIKSEENFKIYDEKRNIISSFEKTVSELDYANERENFEKIEIIFESFNFKNKNDENQVLNYKKVSEQILDSSSSSNASNENEKVNKIQNKKIVPSKNLEYFNVN